MSFNTLFKKALKTVNSNLFNNLIISVFLFFPILILTPSSSPYLLILFFAAALIFVWYFLYFIELQAKGKLNNKLTSLLEPFKRIQKWKSKGFGFFSVKFMVTLLVCSILVLLPVFIYYTINMEIFYEAMQLTEEELSSFQAPPAPVWLIIFMAFTSIFIEFYLFPLIVKSYIEEEELNILKVFYDTAVYIHNNIKIYIKIFLLYLLFELIMVITMGVAYIYIFPLTFTMLYLFFSWGELDEEELRNG